MSKRQRNILAITDKYQMQLILLEIFPLLLIALLLTVIVFRMETDINELLAAQSFGMVASRIAEWFYVAVASIFTIAFIFVIITFKYSQRLVGPFHRILSETDTVIITGNKREIKIRPGDELAEEVVLRINALIKKMK